MREEDWQDEIVGAAEASAGVPIPWEALIDHTELIRHDLRILRADVVKLEEAFGVGAV